MGLPAYPHPQGDGGFARIFSRRMGGCPGTPLPKNENNAAVHGSRDILLRTISDGGVRFIGLPKINQERLDPAVKGGVAGLPPP